MNIVLWGALLLQACASTPNANEPMSAADVVETRVVMFVPNGQAAILVLGAGTEARVQVGDRGHLACDDTAFVVTEVFPVRARVTQDKIALPVASRARIWLNGAAPSRWCPDPAPPARP